MEMLVKILCIIAVIVTIILIVYFLVFHSPFTFYYVKSDEKNFNRINLFKNISNEVQINKIAMIGSHDCLTYGITGYRTDPNGYEYPNLDKFLPKWVVPSMIRRLAVTQNLPIYEQLMAGARYFDFRISLVNNVFYGTHELLGREITNDLLDFVKFITLSDDFVILDVRIHKNDTETTEKFLDLCRSTELTNALANVPEPVSTSKLGLVRGKIILMLNSDIDYPGVYNSDEVFTKWKYAAVIPTLQTNIINHVAAYSQEQKEAPNRFYVNQLQMSFDGDYIQAVKNFSLLHMARRSNNEITLTNEQIKAAPILYLDNVGTASKLYIEAQIYNESSLAVIR